jgi:hypothetical protein
MNPNAASEARTLWHLVTTGQTDLRQMLDVIEVQPEHRRILRAFARAYPEQHAEITSILKYRRQVLAEFVRLVHQATRRKRGPTRVPRKATATAQ